MYILTIWTDNYDKIVYDNTYNNEKLACVHAFEWEMDGYIATVFAAADGCQIY